MARDRKVKSPFTTAGSSEVRQQQAVQTEFAASPAEFASPIAAAVPGIKQGLNIAVDSYKRDLTETTRASFEPEAAAIIAAANQTEAGNKLSDLNEDILKSSLIQQLGVKADDPRITEAQSFFNKLADAESKGRSIRRHTETLASKELKRMVAANPLFEAEIRGAATQALGFDPTGKDVTSALARFDKTTKPKKLTAFQIDVANRNSSGLYATPEDAFLAAQQVQSNKFKQEQLLIKSTMKELGSDEVVELSRATSSGIFDSALQLHQQLLNDPSTSGKAQAIAKDFVNQRFLKAKADFSRVTAGTVNSEVVDRELANFDKTHQDTLKMFDDGSWNEIMIADNALIQQTALNDAFGIQGVVAAYTLGGDRFLDTWSWMSKMSNNENFRRMITAKSPVEAAGYDLARQLMGMEKANKRVVDQTPATTEIEVIEASQSVNAIVTGKNTSDAEKANYVNGASKVMPIPTLLSQFNTDQHKLSVLQNPKLKEQFVNIYAEERVRSTDIVANSMALLGSAVTLGVTDEGKISITQRAGAQISQDAVGAMGALTDGVRRMNNIISLTKRYSGTVIKAEPNIAQDTIDQTKPAVGAKTAGEKLLTEDPGLSQLLQGSAIDK